ncbi:hypothetical protein M1567_00020 [Candidatus Marsarchaeota archaeon]|nr:hypothetical protein [Candidatus Marsarchaeota archaeon]
MGMKNQKAQSAMEYLMTYGWAILIIAIVLAALFSLGIFSSSSFTGTTCVASSGFLCTSPVWTSGNLIVTVGQSTGASWTGVTFFFMPSGSAAPSSSSATGALVANSACSDIDLASGQTVSCTIPMSTFSTTPGTSASGQLWVEYSVSGDSAATDLVSQIATMTLKES